MPIIVPMPIWDTAISQEGNIIGLRKTRYMLGSFTNIPLPSTAVPFKEQVLIGDSSLFDETPGRAETVIITNV